MNVNVHRFKVRGWDLISANTQKANSNGTCFVAKPLVPIEPLIVKSRASPFQSFRATFFTSLQALTNGRRESVSFFLRAASPLAILAARKRAMEWLFICLVRAFLCLWFVALWARETINLASRGTRQVCDRRDDYTPASRPPILTMPYLFATHINMGQRRQFVNFNCCEGACPESVQQSRRGHIINSTPESGL